MSEKIAQLSERVLELKRDSYVQRMRIAELEASLAALKARSVGSWIEAAEWHDRRLKALEEVVLGDTGTKRYEYRPLCIRFENVTEELGKAINDGWNLKLAQWDMSNETYDYLVVLLEREVQCE